MGTLLDAYGRPVGTDQPTYVSWIYNYGYGSQLNYAPNPNYIAPTPAGTIITTTTTFTPTPPEYSFQDQTIGQTIPRMIGHVRVPLRPIWYEGVVKATDVITSATITFAAAIGRPIDPSETGFINSITARGEAVYDPDASGDGVVIPPGTSDADAALLRAALLGAIIYPGDEAQDPCPLIVADRGAPAVSAYRGLRYIVIPNWPLKFGMPSDMQLGWTSTSSITLNQGGNGQQLNRPGIITWRLPTQATDGYWELVQEYRACGAMSCWCFGGGYWWATFGGSLLNDPNIRVLGWDVRHTDCASGAYDIVPAYVGGAPFPQPDCVACWNDFCFGAWVAYYRWHKGQSSRVLPKPDINAANLSGPAGSTQYSSFLLNQPTNL